MLPSSAPEGEGDGGGCGNSEKLRKSDQMTTKCRNLGVAGGSGGDTLLYNIVLLNPGTPGTPLKNLNITWVL